MSRCASLVKKLDGLSNDHSSGEELFEIDFWTVVKTILRSQTMASRSEAPQLPASLVAGTIYERHAEPGISDTLPNAEKSGSKVRKAARQQDQSESRHD